MLLTACSKHTGKQKKDASLSSRRTPPRYVFGILLTFVIGSNFLHIVVGLEFQSISVHARYVFCTHLI